MLLTLLPYPANSKGTSWTGTILVQCLKVPGMQYPPASCSTWSPPD